MIDQQAALSARAALRKATCSVHERLHVAPPFLALAQGRLSHGEYAALLSKMAGYYFSVAQHVPIEPNRLQLLRQDLLAVNAPEPSALCIPRPQGEGQRLGWRYVVEGSIFGGHVIYRQLDYLFGDEVSGRSFFRGTATSARHWQALCSELEGAGTMASAIDTMIEGALAAFAVFESMIAVKESAHI